MADHVSGTAFESKSRVLTVSWSRLLAHCEVVQSHDPYAHMHENMVKALCLEHQPQTSETEVFVQAATVAGQYQHTRVQSNLLIFGHLDG